MNLITLTLTALCLSTCNLFINKVSGEVVSDKVVVLPEGQLKFYYDDSITSDPCDTVVMINVGAAMSATEYNDLGHSIASSSNKELSIIAIIMDDNPGDIRKQDQNKYANLANAIVKNLKQIVLICANRKQAKINYIIGGHSAGGEAAIRALTNDPPLISFDVAGIVGLAPYQIDPKSTAKINVPSLMWGFAHKTCLVVSNKSDLAAYNISNSDRRVLYQVQNKFNVNPISGPHCSFADKSCKGICGGGDEYAWIRKSGVGDSVYSFILAIRSSSFTKTIFKDQNGTRVFLNKELAFARS